MFPCRISQGSGKDGLVPENEEPAAKRMMPTIEEDHEYMMREEDIQEDEEMMEGAGPAGEEEEGEIGFHVI